MKILQLCNRVPWPPKDGGAIAMVNMTKAFHALGEELHLLALNTAKHHIGREDLPPLFSQIASFNSVAINTDIKWHKALLNLVFSKASYNITRFYSRAFEEELVKILQQLKPDIVQIEGLHMCQYISTIRQHSSAKVVLRAHNLEYLIWERLAHAEKSYLRKSYMQLLAARMRRFETNIVKKIDALVAITPQDAGMFESMGCLAPVFVSPTGLDMENYALERAELEWPSVFHIGSLDWLPNQQGIKWFLEHVWPALHKEFPNLNFYIAGRHMPHWMLAISQPGVKAAGEVEDANRFINSKGIMIVPLLSGSGMRIKIIEGMALAKPIVSTTIGAEGIEIEEGRNIIIADSPEAFREAIASLLRGRQKAEDTGKAARMLVEEKYSNNVLVGRLLSFYNSLLQ